MKKYAFWLVFFYVLLFFVILPIGGQFFGERQTEIVACYPFSVFFNAAISLIIYFYSRKSRLFNRCFEGTEFSFFIFSSSVLICFGILCISSVIFELLTFFLSLESGITNVIFPSSFLGWSNFFLGVICAAFFEEVIYRFYLPNVFQDFFYKRKMFRDQKSERTCDIKEGCRGFCSTNYMNNLKLLVLSEGPALLFFGLGHVYLGLPGFLNALVCGAALRICMIRTKSLLIPFVIHTVYNFLSFLAVYVLF